LFLIGDDEKAHAQFKMDIVPYFAEFISHIDVEVSKDHMLTIPSLLWCMLGLDLLESNKETVRKCLYIVQE